MAKEETKVEEGEVYTYDWHRKHHGGGIIGGLFLVFLGIVFLLNNLGLVPGSVWNELWKFWPVLVILIGIRILAGRNVISRIIITILTLFVFAGVLAYILYYYGVLRIVGFPNS
jgi:hypothetical protein